MKAVDIVLTIQGTPGHVEYQLGEDDVEEIVETIERYAAHGTVEYGLRFDGMTVDMDGFRHTVTTFDRVVPRDIYDEVADWYQAVEYERDSLVDKNDALHNDLEEIRDAKKALEEQVTELEEQLAEYEGDDLPAYVESPHYLPPDALAGVTFDRLGGVDEEVGELRRILGETDSRFLENLDALEPDSTGMNGILLYGPPGTGKTMAMKAAANELDYEIFLVKGPELFNKFYGESEKQVRQVVEHARQAAPALIVLDEFDAIAAKRSGGAKMPERIVTQLLTEMDGFEDNSDVHLIATTNRKDRLDEAILRPGRLGTHIEFGRPTDRDTIQDIAEIYFPDEQADVVTRTITGNQAYVENNTGAMISEVRRQAVRLFDERNQEENGALIEGIVEEELDRYMGGEEDPLFSYEESFHVNRDRFSLDALKHMLVREAEEELFTEKQHLRAIPDTVIEDAVHAVYNEDTEPAGSRIGFQ